MLLRVATVVLVLAAVGRGQTVETWSSDRGTEFEGTLVGFGEASLKVWKKFGKVYVNGEVYKELDAEKKHTADVILKTAGITDPERQVRWSQPKTVTHHVARLVGRRQSQEVQVPLGLFSERDRARLAGPYAAWIAEQEQARQARLSRPKPVTGSSFGPICPICGTAMLPGGFDVSSGTLIQFRCSDGHVVYK